MGLAHFLHRLLEHPLTRGKDLDDPQTTALRRAIVEGKPFLRQLYAEWFEWIRAALPRGPGAVLELGSGAADLRGAIPEVLRSEVFRAPDLALVADGCALPFAPGALRAIVLVDVMHHLPDLARFLDEAAACVRPGGAIVAVEPWVTRWSRFVYARFHHESFQPERAEWSLPAGGPLSGANGALPWIALVRDRARLERDHPQWRVARVEPRMPVSYLLSGGISLRNLAPGWLYPVVRRGEELFAPWAGSLAMFAAITLERTGVPARR